MRTEQHMGWGAIAKSLGAHPGALGQALWEERKEQRITMKEKRRDQSDRKSEHKSEK